MSNYVEYNNRIAFHPGYYIKEIVEESGLTQEDFAKRLGTTPKNLSILIRGEQSLSIDMAMRLSRMLGTSIQYWLNLQNTYNTLIAEFKSEEELVLERKVFEKLDYKYFKEYFGLPDLPRKINEQIKQVRECLNVATLTVLEKKELSVCFRSAVDTMSDSNIIKANTMVQIAINQALNTNRYAKFNKTKFKQAVDYALTLTKNHDDFFPSIKKSFLDAGVIFIILPNISGSKINGATKKIGDQIMLMVNDRRLYSDTFWFTLFHEVGHIMNGDFGISFENENNQKEISANKYAEDLLIHPSEYAKFIENNDFSKDAIINFAKHIDRDPGIILGRLQNEKLVDYKDRNLQSLKHKYKVKLANNSEM